MNHQRIIHAKHEPPANELPVVLATPDVMWRGDGIVVAIPSLLVYTTGAELVILCRTRQAHRRDFEYSRASVKGLQSLKANGIPVELLGGEHKEHGFTYRAWIPFSPDGAGIPDGDITFELGWPEAEHTRHRVPGVREIAGRAVILW
jgi:hypothetical protein